MTLITDYYREQNAALHAQGRFGGSGHKHAAAIQNYARELGTKSLLDYGCGQGKLRLALPDFDIAEYDPAIPAHASDPLPADLLLSTDVLEHVEPECLDAVLAHMKSLARVGAYLAIALRPDSKKTLPDGTNPHRIIESSGWWLKRLKPYLKVENSRATSKEVVMWCRAW